MGISVLKLGHFQVNWDVLITLDFTQLVHSLRRLASSLKELAQAFRFLKRILISLLPGNISREGTSEGP